MAKAENTSTENVANVTEPKTYTWSCDTHGKYKAAKPKCDKCTRRERVHVLCDDAAKNVSVVANHRFWTAMGALRAFSRCFSDKYDWSEKQDSLEKVQKDFGELVSLINDRIEGALNGETVKESAQTRYTL